MLIDVPTDEVWGLRISTIPADSGWVKQGVNSLTSSSVVCSLVRYSSLSIDNIQSWDALEIQKFLAVLKSFIHEKKWIWLAYFLEISTVWSVEPVSVTIISQSYFFRFLRQVSIYFSSFFLPLSINKNSPAPEITLNWDEGKVPWYHPNCDISRHSIPLTQKIRHRFCPCSSGGAPAYSDKGLHQPPSLFNRKHLQSFPSTLLQYTYLLYNLNYTLSTENSTFFSRYCSVGTATFPLSTAKSNFPMCRLDMKTNMCLEIWTLLLKKGRKLR